MSGPRVARLDDAAPDAEPAAAVLDLGEVGHGPSEAAAVAPLGAVPGAGPSPAVADLDAVGQEAEAGGSGPPDDGPGPDGGRAHRDRSDGDRSAPQAGAGTADLGAIGGEPAVPVRVARLPQRTRSDAGRDRTRSSSDDRRGSAAGRSTAGRVAAGRAAADGAALDGAALDGAAADGVVADGVVADGAAGDGAVGLRDDRRRPDRTRGRARQEPPEGEDGTAGRGGSRPARERRPPGPRQIDPDADPVAAAREICLRLLTDRARTRSELAQALARRGVPAAAADTVLERFDEVGLIDDAAFAGQWVRSRHRNRGLARRAIAQELRRKGVDDEVAGEALAEVDGESEARRARELVDRKLRTVPADTPEQRSTAARRLVGMLARKGYGAGVAYGVVKEALAEHGADHDELGGDDPFPDR